MLDFRPHHLLWLLGFDGRGPSQAFIDNAHSLQAHLEGPNGWDAKVRVVFGVDAVCLACPERLGRRCDRQDEMDRLDRVHAEILGLTDQLVLPWGELRRRLAEHLGDPRLEAAAQSCPGSDPEACRRGLEHLRAEGHHGPVSLIRPPRR